MLEEWDPQSLSWNPVKFVELANKTIIKITVSLSKVLLNNVLAIYPLT